MFHWFFKIDHFFSRTITFFLTLAVIMLITLSGYSVLSRWMQWTNLWVDPLCRHLVLALIFLGATLAIERKKHIRIDALILLFEKKISHFKIQLWEVGLNLITLVIVYALFMSALAFWKSELAYPVDAFLGLKQYHLCSIIPLGFLLLLIKYTFTLILSLYLLSGKVKQV